MLLFWYASYGTSRTTVIEYFQSDNIKSDCISWKLIDVLFCLSMYFSLTSAWLFAELLYLIRKNVDPLFSSGMWILMA